MNDIEEAWAKFWHCWRESPASVETQEALQRCGRIMCSYEGDESPSDAMLLMVPDDIRQDMLLSFLAAIGRSMLMAHLSIKVSQLIGAPL